MQNRRRNPSSHDLSQKISFQNDSQDPISRADYQLRGVRCPTSFPSRTGFSPPSFFSYTGSSRIAEWTSAPFFAPGADSISVLSPIHFNSSRNEIRYQPEFRRFAPARKFRLQIKSDSSEDFFEFFCQQRDFVRVAFQSPMT